jgi:hypothetical protein
MADPAQGRTIRIFLVDGKPTGILTAEIGNWSGKIVVGGRIDLPEIVRRSECGKTGIYFLIGSDIGSPQRMKVYVGEGDSVSDRLKKHNADGSKDFFDRVCVVVSKDENLTKAHARYLESRFIEIIKAAGRAGLANGNEPAFDLLPESDRADMEGFIGHVRLVLPVLGFDIAREPVSISVATKSPERTGPIFRITSVGVDARMSPVADEYVVHKGSTARADAKAAYNAYQGLRDQLKAEGKLVVSAQNPSLLVFTEDVPFASLSAAAAVVLDRQAAGPSEWKVDGSKISYAEWQQAQL